MTDYDWTICRVYNHGSSPCYLGILYHDRLHPFYSDNAENFEAMVQLAEKYKMYDTPFDQLFTSEDYDYIEQAFASDYNVTTDESVYHCNLVQNARLIERILDADKKRIIY